MADKIPHEHGSAGAQPPSGLDFSSGDFPDPEIFDWFWRETTTTVNSHADRLDEIDSNNDGRVDAADVADTATNLKGNDIDSDGDGKVDAAEQADNATNLKGNDIDSDGDGKVDAADRADTVDGNDPSDIASARRVEYESGSVGGMPTSRTKQGEWNIVNGILQEAVVGEQATGNYSSTKSELVFYLDDGSTFSVARDSSGDEYVENTYTPTDFGNGHDSGLITKVEWYTNANDDDNSSPAEGHSAEFKFVIEEMYL